MQAFGELLVVSKRLVAPLPKFLIPQLQLQCQVRSESSGAPGSGGGVASSSGAPMSGIGGDGSPAGTMSSWQIHNYGGPSELQLSTTTKIPQLNGPDEILVQVKAASVNPIDLEMTKGYGADVINILRDLCPSTPTLSGISDLPQKLSSYLLAPVKGKKQVIEFPLIMGRDFAGVVTQLGHGVKSDLRVGDEVYGVVGVQRPGSHAEYVVAAEDTIKRKPSNLSFAEAASIPYAGLTAWSAIKVTGNFFDLKEKKFLLLGGSGGVGTFAMQYLKSQKALVVTTCSKDAMPMVQSLGPHQVIDYKDPDFAKQVKESAPYDCILHFSGPQSTEKAMELTKHLKPMSGQFITLSPPFLANVDKYGLAGGFAKNLSELVSSNVKTWTDSKAVTKWAFFIPSGDPLKTFADLIMAGHIRPVVQSVYSFENLPEAYKKLEEGHLRGKIVVEM